MKNFLIAVAAIAMFAFASAEEAQAQLFGRTNVVVSNNNRGGSTVVQSRSGLFGLRRNTVVVNNNANRGFNNNVRFVRVQNVNGYNRGFNNNVRVNSFGTRTFVDNRGNVFAVDAFGNKQFRGNSFNRGFSNHGLNVNVRSNNGFFCR